MTVARGAVFPSFTGWWWFEHPQKLRITTVCSCRRRVGTPLFVDDGGSEKGTSGMKYAKQFPSIKTTYRRSSSGARARLRIRPLRSRILRCINLFYLPACMKNCVVSEGMRLGFFSPTSCLTPPRVTCARIISISFFFYSRSC